MATKRIAASGGDYTNLSEWFSALPATLTEPEIVEVESFDLVDALYIGGKTQTAAEYVEIRAATGHRHTGIAGSGARVRMGTAGTNSPIRIGMPFVRIDGLELFVDKSGSTISPLLMQATTAGSDVRINGCLIHDVAASGTTYSVTAALANLNLSFTNNIVYGARRSADFRTCASVKLYNNIFWRSAANIGVLCDAATTARNNYSGASASGTEDFWTGGTAPTGSHNVSSDATATVDYATGSQINVSGTSVFASVTSGGEDFRPLNGTTALLNTGTTVAAVTTDAIGVSRPQGASYDIGAFEYAAAGSPDATGTGALASITLTAPTGSATGTGGATNGTGTGTLQSIILTAPAGTATGTSAGSGTITTPVMKNNTGTVLANETGVIVNVYNASTGALIVQKTGQTSNASGIVTISDALIVPATTYAYEVVLTGSRRRLPTASAA